MWRRTSSVFLVVLAGCATFKSDQTDLSTVATYEEGKLVSIETRQIKSFTKARTFFESRSKVTGFKALQTDRTQSSSIGELNQEASSTNLVKLAEAVATGVVNGLKKFP